MIILPTLTTSLIHFSLKGWEHVVFVIRSERANALQHSYWFRVDVLVNHHFKAELQLVDGDFVFAGVVLCSSWNIQEPNERT